MEQILKNHFDESKRKKIIDYYNYTKTLDNSSIIYNSSFAYQTVDILCNVLGDYDSIVTAIFYPFIKRDIITIDDVEKLAGNVISTMLKSLLKIEKLKINNKEAEEKSIKQMFIALAADIKVIIVKLAIELTKVRFLDKYKIEDCYDLMEKIKSIYAPLSAMIGIGYIKNEMENELFKFYKPEQYTKLNNEIQQYIKGRKEQIDVSIKRITEEAKESNIDAEIYGRHKELHSIYKKLIWKNKELKQIYDILAIRVLVNTIDECYIMLGKIHSIYPPIEHFKDYIAQPKENGYQSLHTTVIVENGDPLEIQIRTFDMHKYAEYGFASHVAYKEHRKVDKSDQKLSYIRSVLELYKKSSDEELLNILKTDVYSDKIFVQTPNGKILQFLEGATPIDFAYAIHTNVGHKCVGAKINDKLVPLTTPLSNGDVVEIITNPNIKGPSRDWLNHCKCASTKSKINSFFKKEMKEENIKKGKIIFESYLKTKSVNESQLLSQEILDELFKANCFENINDMYASIGYGGTTCAKIFAKIKEIAHKKNLIDEKPKIAIKEQKNTNSSNNKINIYGYSNLLTKIGQCCNPLPGDEIIGYVSRGKGVTVHRKDCKTLKNYEKERLIECSWNVNNDDTFVGALTVICLNSPTVLAKLSKKMADLKININSIYAKTINKTETKINIHLHVKTKHELEDIINKLQVLSFVHEIYRTN